MKKRLLSILLVLTMVLSLVPAFTVSASAEETSETTGTVGSYTVLLPDGVTLPSGAGSDTPVTEVKSTDTEWGTASQTTWYVATGTVTIDHTVTVLGDVHLILADGCNLTVNVTSGNGITVDTDCSLTIYAQSEGNGMGSLTVTCANGSVGIGPSSDVGMGNLTINGGKISVSNCAIGLCGQLITISGGDISINCSSYGIMANSMNIAGGDVDVFGSDNGIYAVSFNMTDGDVTAKNSVGTIYYEFYSAICCYTGNVTISGGSLNAIGTNFGIGAFLGNITISGDDTVINASGRISGIYSATSSPNTISIDGASVTACSDYFAILATTVNVSKKNSANEDVFISAGEDAASVITVFADREDTTNLAPEDLTDEKVLADSLSGNKYVRIGTAVCYVDADNDGTLTKGTDTVYGSVQAAVNAAGETATTVRLIANDTENVTIPSKKNITLDLNGYVLKAASAGSVITNNGTLTIKDSNPHSEHKFEVTEDGLWKYKESSSSGTGSINCLIEGTQITMGNGSTSNIEDIKVGDYVRSFNHETGEYESNKVIIAYEGENKASYYTLHFSNGADLGICGAHDLFEQSACKYVTITENNARDYIGKYFYNAISNSWVKLESVSNSSNSKNYYSLYVAKTVNCIANDMLSIPDDINWLDIYKFNADLTTDMDELQKDIDKHGICEYKDAPFVDSYEKYEMLNFRYYNILLGKGLLTKAEAEEVYYEWYSNIGEEPLLMKAPLLMMGSNSFTTTEQTTITNVYGGCITGGVAQTSSGGGAINNNGSLTLNAGSIIGNKTINVDGNQGGGVGNSGTFVMNNGQIVGNYSYHGGAGVFNYGSGTFTMNGGSIENNVARESGGGVGTDGTFRMNGGIITNNQSGDCGGAIYMGQSAKFFVGGKAKVYENLGVKGSNVARYINSSEYGKWNNSEIIIGTSTNLADGNVLKPTDEMYVGVTLLSDGESTSGAFTTNGSSAETKYFFSDVDGYFVKYVTNHLELAFETVKIDKNIENGKIEVEDQETTTQTNITVTPDTNYELKEIIVKDKAGADITSTTLNGTVIDLSTVTNLPVTVSATFKEKQSSTPIYFVPTTTFTVPVSGNESTVKIQAELSGNTAKVKEIKESDLKTVGTEKQVVIDLSEVKDSVDAAVITKTSLQNIVTSGADGMKFIMPDGTVAEFDKTAIKAILDQASGDDIKLVIDRNEKAEQTLTTSQKTTLETMNKPAVLDAYFVSGGKRISDFNGGTATVTAEYKSEYPVRIWYLMNDGEKEAVPSKYDKEKQLATFDVNHFSHYVAEQIEEASEEINKVSEVKIRVYSKYVRVNGKRYIKPYIKVLKGQDTLDTLKDAGYTFKYVFYRSTSTKTSSFKKVYTTKNKNFTDKKGANGKYYYYKAKLKIYDENGKLVTSTTLGQCKYGCRLYNEKSKNMN